MTESPRRAQTRVALIEAAVKVIAARGVDAPVEEFSEAAGFTRGAFYSNFSSKTELCQAILVHYAEKDLAAVQSAIPAALDLAGSMDEVTARAIDNFLALWGADVDALLALHLIRLSAAHDDDLRETVLQTDAAMAGAISPLIEGAFGDRGIATRLPIDEVVMVLRSVYLASLLDAYLAQDLDFVLLRKRLGIVLRALLTTP